MSRYPVFTPTKLEWNIVISYYLQSIWQLNDLSYIIVKTPIVRCYYPQLKNKETEAVSDVYSVVQHMKKCLQSLFLYCDKLNSNFFKKNHVTSNIIFLLLKYKSLFLGQPIKSFKTNEQTKENLEKGNSMQKNWTSINRLTGRFSEISQDTRARNWV